MRKSYRVIIQKVICSSFMHCLKYNITSFRISEKLLQATKDKVEEQLHNLELLKKEYDRFKIMLGQTQQTRSKRIQNATTVDMITDIKNSTRYRRRQETKNILEYIHGGEEAAVLGAWDVVASYASKETMDQLIGSYKRGKYLQGVFGKAVKDFNNSEEALKQAVAMKYQNYLSRRKFKLVCKPKAQFMMQIKKYGYQET